MQSTQRGRRTGADLRPQGHPSEPPEAFLLLTIVKLSGMLSPMFEAQASEFPFMADLPQREKSRVEKAMDVARALTALQEKVGPIIPAGLASKCLNISRQRFHQLVEEGRLKTVQVEGHHYISEADLLEFLKLERKSGRPFKAPTIREAWKQAREWVAEERAERKASKK